MAIKYPLSLYGSLIEELQTGDAIGGTWNGDTIAVAYGGTGVTTSTGSGNNVLSNSPTLVTPALGTPASGVMTNVTGLPLTTGVTGTLPVANGGTGVTTSTGSGNNVLSTSPTLVTPVLGTPSSVTLTNATGLPLTTGVTGTLPIANGGTGQTTASASFNALSPITSTGDLIIGNGSNSATRLAIGANQYVLTSNGTTAVWGAVPSASIVSKMIYDTFTATASQTTFTTSATYTSGKIEVYFNGVKMRNGSDVTVTSGTQVVFATGLASGSLVDLVYPI